MGKNRHPWYESTQRSPTIYRFFSIIKTTATITCVCRKHSTKQGEVLTAIIYYRTNIKSRSQYHSKKNNIGKNNIGKDEDRSSRPNRSIRRYSHHRRRNKSNKTAATSRSSSIPTFKQYSSITHTLVVLFAKQS